VAILVDEPIWDWRGRKWAHLVTDTHLDELHDFAHRLGVPYLAFQGDHYDIHAELRLRAIDLGASAVPGRTVVLALRTAGLRRRGPVEQWNWAFRSPGTDEAGLALGPDDHDWVRAELAGLDVAAHRVEIGLARRSTETLTVVSCEQVVPVETGLEVVDERTTVHRSSGERGTFLERRRLHSA
jgi:hypothetical protein